MPPFVPRRKTKFPLKNNIKLLLVTIEASSGHHFLRLGAKPALRGGAGLRSGQRSHQGHTKTAAAWWRGVGDTWVTKVTVCHPGGGYENGGNAKVSVFWRGRVTPCRGGGRAEFAVVGRV